MAKEIEFNGEVYEFPDEATRGQVTVYLRKRAGLTPGGDNPANAPSAPSADFSERSLAGEAIAGMGRSAAAATSREERHTPESVARDAGAVNRVIGDATGLALDVVGADHPVERVGKAIDLFAAPGKTPIENAAVFAKKAWRAAGETLRETNPVALVAPGAPGGVQSTFLRKLLDKAETQPPVDPARESLVQQRNEQKTAAARAIAAKASGEKIDPADRLALAKLRSGDVPKPDIDPATGELATVLPQRPGGMVESAARAIAQFPAALLETYVDPANAEIMAGQSAASKAISALPIPPQAKAAAQLALASGVSGYFLHGMSGSAGEAIGRAAGGGLDQRFLETEAPHQLANLAFVGHMAGSSGKPLAEHIDASRIEKIRRDTVARVESSRESAVKKVQSNTDKGESPYAGLTPDELSAIAPAERALQRFVGADDLESIAKAAFSDRPDINVKIHEDVSTIPQASQPAVSDIAPTIEGAYESGTNTVHLVRPMLESAADALRVAMHEKTHSLEGIEPAKLAVTSERLFKQQLLSLAEEGVLPREQAESLVGLTGKDFASAVRALDTGDRSPMRAAADETLAVMRQAGFKSDTGDRLVAEPEVGPVNRALGAVANAIPGVQLSPADVTSVVASQARRAASQPMPERPVESVGEAPYYQGRVYDEALSAPAPPGPPAPPPPISVGDRVSAVGPKGKPIEGVLEKVSKSGKTAMVKLDDGKSVRVDFDKVARPEPKPAEPAPVAPETPVAQPAQQNGGGDRGAFFDSIDRGDPRPELTEVVAADTLEFASTFRTGDVFDDANGGRWYFDGYYLILVPENGVVRSGSTVMQLRDKHGAVRPRNDELATVASLRRSGNVPTNVAMSERGIGPEAAPAPVEPPAPVETPVPPEQMDAILASADQRQQPKPPKRERPVVPEGLDEVYDPRLRAEEEAWGGAIERLRQSPEVQRYAGQGVKQGNLDAVRKVILRRGEPLLQAYAKEAARQALGIETPIHPRQLRRTAVPEISPAEAVLTGKPITNADAVLEANKGIRWSRKNPRRTNTPEDPLPREEAVGGDPMLDGLMRTTALADLERAGIDIDSARRRGGKFWHTSPENGDLIFGTVDENGIVSAMALKRDKSVRWSYARKGDWNPKEHPLWDHSDTAREIILTDPDSRIERLNDLAVAEGIERNPADPMSPSGARSLNRLNPLQREIAVISKFNGNEASIADAVGIPAERVHEAILDLANREYHSPDARAVLHWYRRAFRDAYAQRYGLRPEDLGASRRGGDRPRAAAAGGLGELATARGDGAGAGAEVAPLVIRPQGWDAATDAVSGLTRPGHLYRGMTEAEFNATVGSGRGVSSRQDYSVRGEGTSFSDDAAAAESYVNFGRDDPRKTGRPTYLVEVSAGPDVAFDRRDGYHKAAGEIPADRITRVLRMEGRDGAIVASDVPSQRAEVAPFPEAETAPPASDGLRLSRSRPNDKLLRPILGDLVELSAQMLADKRNGIESADDLFAALSDGMGASFADRVKKASPYLYEQASAEASQRENLGPTIKQAIEQQLKPKGDQSRPIAATHREIAEASDYLRETHGLATQQGNKKAIAAGLELYANLGYEGVAQLIHNAADRTKSESILFGKELPPEVVVAAKLALNDPEANARAERDPKSMVDQVALWQAWRTIGSLQSESFRLRSFRENMMPEPERVKARLRELVIGSNASRRAFTEKDAVAQIKKLKTFLKKRLGVEDVDSIPLETLSNKDEMSKLANELSALNANAGMKLRTYLINNLVSQFSTNTANIVGNLGNAGVEYIAYRRLEAVINRLLGFDGVMPSDLRGIPALLAKAHRDALEDAKSYWKTGYNPTYEMVHGADWIDQLGSQIRSFGGKYTRHIEKPTLALGAEDAYFVSMLGRVEAMASARGIVRREMVDAAAKVASEKYGISLKDAKKKVDVEKILASDEYNKRVFGLFDDMKSEAWVRAMDRAYYLTFKSESNRVLKTLLMVKNRHPNFVWVQSFLTMPINGMLRGAEMVPGVGLVSGGMFGDIGKLRRGEITSDQFKTQMSRIAAGQMIGVLGAIALSRLNLTQYGDDGEEPFITGSSLPRGMDSAEAEAQRRSLEPYTVRVPFTDTARVSYRRFEPLSTAIGLTVDGVAAFEDFAKRRNMGRTFTRLKNALYGQIAEKPFLQGINNIADWLRDAPGAPNPLFTYSSMLTPKVLTQFPRAFDPYVREGRLYGADATQEGYSQWERFPHAFVQATTNIPWGIEPRVTLLGDEVRKSGNPLQRLLLGDELRTESRSSTDQQTLDDKYLELAQRAGEDTPNLPREMRGDIQFGERKFKVDPKEWAQMEKDRGVILRDVARQLGLLDDPNRKMTPEDVEILRSVSESSAKMARGKLAPKYMALPRK